MALEQTRRRGHPHPQEKGEPQWGGGVDAPRPPVHGQAGREGEGDHQLGEPEALAEQVRVEDADFLAGTGVVIEHRVGDGDTEHREDDDDPTVALLQSAKGQEEADQDAQPDNQQDSAHPGITPTTRSSHGRSTRSHE